MSKPLKGLAQSTTALERLFSSCLYLQVQKYFKNPTFPFVSRALSCTHIVICISGVHSYGITPQDMFWLKPGPSWLGSNLSLLGFTSLLVFREDVFPAESPPHGWEESIHHGVGQWGVMPGSSAVHSKGKRCWNIITFFFSTRWAAVRALCCSIHSSLYLCWRRSKRGVQGLENIEKATV